MSEEGIEDSSQDQTLGNEPEGPDARIIEEALSEAASKMAAEFEGNRLNAKKEREGVQTDSTEDLGKILRDFTRDVLVTFPELKESLNSDLQKISGDAELEDCKEAVLSVKEKLLKTYPEKFFDILYQNAELFDKPGGLYLLPGIDFRKLWGENISDSTRETIWKYLQLVLFTLVADMQSGASFGDAAQLFEAIDPAEFKGKLEETIADMQKCFEEEENGEDGEDDEDSEGGAGAADSTHKSSGSQLPNAQKLHEHVQSMMGGKLGQLAQEIAEEAASELDIDPDTSSHKGLFQSLLKNPIKLISLVKKVGGKLNDKIKSGEIKEAELLKEASEIMKKMKDMPGMSGLEGLLRKNAGGAMPDFSAMEAQLKRSTRMATQRDRMREKLAKRQQETTHPTAAAATSTPLPPDSDATAPGDAKKKRRKKKKKKRAK